MIEREPKLTKEWGSSGQLALLCPSCGKPWLHQCGLDVFVRKGEDSDQGQHIDISHSGETKITSEVGTQEGNPSSRRDGIRVQFSCEQCSRMEAAFELIIQQHKGNEFTHWERIEDKTTEPEGGGQDKVKELRVAAYDYAAETSEQKAAEILREEADCLMELSDSETPSNDNGGSE